LSAINDSGAVVTSGLEPGQRIIARGAAQIKDGEVVRIRGQGPAQFNQ